MLDEQLLVGEVVCPMRIERLAGISYSAVRFEHVVPMPRTVRLADTTEVDVGITVTVMRDPNVVGILAGYTSALGNRTLVLSAALRLGADLSSLALNALTAWSNASLARRNSTCLCSCRSRASRSS